MSRAILPLFRFCFNVPCDWLAKFQPFPQPIESQLRTKTNSDLIGRTRFPALSTGDHVFASNCDWFIVLFMSVVIGQSKFFGFVFTRLNLKTPAK